VKEALEDRALKLGEYIVENKTTVRKAARKFGVSKSTVHKDVSERLKYINLSLYRDVKKILEINKAQRHIRGGFATKNKYAMQKPQKKLI
jgi:putative DeoR family transcriptional regulator (stage III sporulation protein D)